MVYKVLRDDTGDDDYDVYDEFDETLDGNDEIDHEAMRKGEEAIAEVLGKRALLLTEKQIQNALWHAYYDPGEAITSLQDTHLQDSDEKVKAFDEVCAAFDEAHRKEASDQRIRDALIHYDWDVGKSEAYIRRKYVDASTKTRQTKEKTTAGKLELLMHSVPCIFPGASGQRHNKRKEGLCCGRQWVPEARLSGATEFSVLARVQLPAESFFWGLPRIGLAQTAVLSGPNHPGGLLGGAPSKLQALAAKRKKKSEGSLSGDALAAAVGSSLASPSSPETTRKNSAPGSLGQAKRQAETSAQSLEPTLKKLNLGRTKPETKGVESGQVGLQESKDVGAANNAPEVAADAHRPSYLDEECLAPTISKPSGFAMTLFCQDPVDSKAAPPGSVPLPYTSSPLWDPDAFNKPSPDDIVTAAQSHSKALTPKGNKTLSTPKSKTPASTPKGVLPKKSAANQTPAATPDSAMAKLNLGVGARPQHKNIDVLAEYEKAKKKKKSTSFVVVGHVDAGKSTLMGRLLLELKFVEKHTVEKYRRQAEKIGKQSFELAWVMDQTEEERSRGVTMDIATNHFETEKTKFTILDAPGHRDFIPNMIAGASQADFAILVIDASTGAFEKGLKGQTYEHVLLLRSLGVHRIIVAVNKMDTASWSRARFDEISQQVSAFLIGKSFLQKNISFIPISGFHGDNVTRPSSSDTTDAAGAWYKGPTLLAQLDEVEPAPRPLQAPFRMAVAEVWKSPLGKATLSGRIDKGSVQVGDAVMAQPSGEAGYVKSILVDAADLRDWAVAGDHVSLTLAGADTDQIRGGDILCPAATAVPSAEGGAGGGSRPIACGSDFTMKAMAFDHLMPMVIDLHRGRLHSDGKLAELVAVLDKATGEITQARPKVVKPGQVARVKVTLSHKIPLEKGQRVVIRSDGETIAAGLIE